MKLFIKIVFKKVVLLGLFFMLIKFLEIEVFWKAVCGILGFTLFFLSTIVIEYKEVMKGIKQ